MKIRFVNVNLVYHINDEEGSFENLLLKDEHKVHEQTI
jgi:hypothetical protein